MRCLELARVARFARGLVEQRSAFFSVFSQRPVARYDAASCALRHGDLRVRGARHQRARLPQCARKDSLKRGARRASNGSIRRGERSIKRRLRWAHISQLASDVRPTQSEGNAIEGLRNASTNVRHKACSPHRWSEGQLIGSLSFGCVDAAVSSCSLSRGCIPGSSDGPRAARFLGVPVGRARSTRCDGAAGSWRVSRPVERCGRATQRSTSSGASDAAGGVDVARQARVARSAGTRKISSRALMRATRRRIRRPMREENVKNRGRTPRVGGH